MPSTIQNIPLIRNQWVDLYSASGITVGTQIVIENLTDTPVKLYAGATPPPDADENDGYFRRLMEYAVKSNDVDDVGAWALCEGDGAFVSVKEMIYSFQPKDFLFELAQGNIPGQSSFGFITKNDNVSTTRVDQWDDASMMVYPANDTISETWEISSLSPNDTNGGTGAWNAIIISLDDNFLRVTHTVDLNGTTPVTIPGLHTRPHQVILPSSGSSGANEGKVTVRVAGSGLLRNTVRVGESLSFDGHFTVPADKKAFIMQTYTNFSKNLDGNARTTIKDASNPNASWILATGLDVYQSFIPFEVKAFFPLATKTDLRVASSVTSGIGQVTVIFEIILVDL